MRDGDVRGLACVCGVGTEIAPVVHGRRTQADVASEAVKCHSADSVTTSMQRPGKAASLTPRYGDAEPVGIVVSLPPNS